jgi:hypothetical protein
MVPIAGKPSTIAASGAMTPVATVVAASVFRDVAVSLIRSLWIKPTMRTQCQCASTAKSNSATILVILIIGFTAGPAVSL